MIKLPILRPGNRSTPHWRIQWSDATKAGSYWGGEGVCSISPHTHTSTFTVCSVLYCLSRFFNAAMDQLRDEFNKEGQRVVFVATSDDFHWMKKHLVDKQAQIYFLEHFLPPLDLSLSTQRGCLINLGTSVENKKQDIFFPYELVPASRAPLPSNRFAMQSHQIQSMYNTVYSKYRVCFFTGTPPKSSKNKKVNLG